MRLLPVLALLTASALAAACDGTDPSNTAPAAAFSVACNQLQCAFEDGSNDPDGTIAVRAWDFGDGETSAEPNPTHIYLAPGGQFTVTLVVTDDGGLEATAVRQVQVAQGSAPDRSGAYMRETPHNAPGRHSRYVLHDDGRFELYDGTGADTTTYTGRYVFACCWGGWAIEPDAVILLDFDRFQNDGICGEAYGSFLIDGHLGIAYCGEAIRAGLEEGVYSSVPDPGTPSRPPPQTGELAFVRAGRIYRVNTDGSGLVQLSDGPGDSDPAWSPDGTRIAFTRTAAGATGVFIMDADGSNAVQRTTTGSDPTWSPDGEWIAFICFTPEVGYDVCTVKADDPAASPVNITRHFALVSAPAWSPDGSRIAFISDRAFYDFWFDIWLVAPDGSQLVAVTTHTPANPNPDEQHQPAWSPDGRRIAHVECPWAWRVCSSSVIEVMNADGSGALRLAVASGYASPTWSPDGRVIGFASANAILWVSADGSQRGRIIDDGYSPAWRP